MGTSFQRTMEITEGFLKPMIDAFREDMPAPYEAFGHLYAAAAADNVERYEDIAAAMTGSAILNSVVCSTKGRRIDCHKPPAGWSAPGRAWENTTSTCSRRFWAFLTIKSLICL